MITDKVKEAIFMALQSVSSVNSPQIYKRIQTVKGYRMMEERIIDKMVRFAMIPESCIVQLEMEYDEIENE